MNVLVVARDAGAAAALAPVVRGLRRVAIIAWGNAADVFAAEGFAAHPFAEEPTPGEVADVIAATGAAVVLSGTSFRPELDGRFWAAGVPSLAVLDHWKNYAERFSVIAPFDMLPTAIAVMDEAAASELVALGCPPGRIRVTGQPRFDAVAPRDRVAARKALGIDASRPMALFASQPRGRPFDEGGGFTSAEALAMFVAGVEAAAPEMFVVAKPHPLEDVRDFSGVAVAEGPFGQLAAAADVVGGITSIVLLDSALMGRLTISVRPGGEPSHFVDVHSELIRTATTVEEVRRAVEEGLAQPPRLPGPPRKATERIISELDELVGGAGILRP